MAFSPPEYCRLFGQKKAYQGGGGGARAPQDPPSYAPDVQMVLKSLLPKVKTMQLFRRTPQKETLIVKKRHISQFKEFNWDHPGPMEVV